MDELIKEKIKEWQYILPRLLEEAKMGTCDTLTFEIRTKEKGHNIPHVHVSTRVASLSIAIETGEVLAQSGKIRERNIQKAKAWIRDNRDFLASKWNELADSPIQIAI